MITANANTISVICTVPLRVGQATFLPSSTDSRANWRKSCPAGCIGNARHPASMTGEHHQHAQRHRRFGEVIEAIDTRRNAYACRKKLWFFGRFAHA